MSRTDTWQPVPSGIVYRNLADAAKKAAWLNSHGKQRQRWVWRPGVTSSGEVIMERTRQHGAPARSVTPA